MAKMNRNMEKIGFKWKKKIVGSQQKIAQPEKGRRDGNPANKKKTRPASWGR